MMLERPAGGPIATMSAEYDEFGDVYEQCIEQSEIARRNLPFYVRLGAKSPGTVVELGVGTGRIAVEVARRGKHVIGVDNSLRMLDACRRRAAEAGVADSVHLIHSDFRAVTLAEPVPLVTMPFHTICDIAEPSDRAQVLRRVADSLLPGGRFVFDHFVFDAELAQRYDNVPHIEAEYMDPETGREVIFWTCGIYDLEDQRIRVVAWSDELDRDGVLVRRRYRRYTSCWIETEQMRAELETAGLEVEAVYGDFDGTPLTEDAAVNVWIARKPS